MLRDVEGTDNDGRTTGRTDRGRTTTTTDVGGRPDDRTTTGHDETDGQRTDDDDDDDGDEGVFIYIYIYIYIYKFRRAPFGNAVDDI